MPAPYVPPGYDFKKQHDGSERLAINNSFMRRLTTRLALRNLGRFYEREGLCVPISQHKIVKAGLRVHLTEAATMQYVATHTSIPVPKVYCSFLHKKIAYIVMERIQGEELPKAWKKLSAEALQGIFAQLKKMLAELRDLPPPTNAGVQSCVGGSLLDTRIPRGNPRFGPFNTIQYFHKWLRGDFRQEDLDGRKKDQDSVDLQDMLSKHDGSWPTPRFTHGDLNPFNIIVHGDQVVGIIDWEFSGWYPDYWEYTSSWFGNIIREEWQGLLDNFLDRPHPEVFKMGQIRNKWWGEF